MRGEARHSALRDQKFISNAVTDACYRLLLIDDYPGLVVAPHEEGNSVAGELWSVDRACLRHLDSIECVDDGLYERKEIRLANAIDHVEAWFYLQETLGLTDLGTDWRSR